MGGSPAEGGRCTNTSGGYVAFAATDGGSRATHACGTTRTIGPPSYVRLASGHQTAATEKGRGFNFFAFEKLACLSRMVLVRLSCLDNVRAEWIVSTRFEKVRTIQDKGEKILMIIMIIMIIIFYILHILQRHNYKVTKWEIVLVYTEFKYKFQVNYILSLVCNKFKICRM